MDLALQMIQAAILANPAYAEAYNNLGESICLRFYYNCRGRVGVNKHHKCAVSGYNGCVGGLNALPPKPVCFVAVP